MRFPSGQSTIRRWRGLLRQSAIVVLAVAVTISASLILATGARADGSPPPITTFPPAGETAPPAETISDLTACSGWYRAGSYGGVWPTASTWWEYRCTYIWPGWAEGGGGATNANWGGQQVSTLYFYWDGSKPVFYGKEFYDGYWDGWYVGSECSYWIDEATAESYGPLYCGPLYF
jgi:hypothetical protein